MLRPAPILATLLLATSLAGCFQQKKDVSEYIARAEKFNADGDVAKARVELQNALRIAPADPKLNLALAKSEEAAGNLKAAIPHYLRAAGPDAHLREAQARVIELLLDSGRLDDAGSRINFMLGSFPNDTDALALRADIEARRDQPTEARNDALAVIQKVPTHPRALAVLAQLDLRNKDPQAALNRVSLGLAKNPEDVRLLQVKAAAQMTADQPDKALETWKNIVRVAPANTFSQAALADLEAQNGHLDRANETFRSAVAANPDNQEMQLAFVRFLASHNKSDDVVSYLRNLIASSPSNNVYDLALAEFFRSNGQIEQAHDVLAAARTRLPDGPEARQVIVGLAKVDAALGRMDLANADLQAVLKADPTNEEALLFQATLEQAGGRGQAAVADLLAVLRVNPVSGRAYDQLATIYAEQGEAKLAAEAMRRAAAVTPGNDASAIRLAAFLQNAGNADEARSIVTRITQKRAENPEAWIASGRMAIARKDWDGANYARARLQEISGTGAAVSRLDGEIQEARGNDALAMQSFKTAINQQPDVDADLIGRFAQASARAGRSAEAADFLADKAKGGGVGQQALLWPAIFTSRADAGDFERALDAFRHATALTPTDVNLYTGAARVLVAQGRVDQARQIVRSGMDAGAPRWTLMITMGDIEIAAGSPQAAMAAYKQAADENPMSIFAANNYGSLLADLDPRNTGALTEARNRLNGQESSRNSSIVDTIAWLDYRLGRMDEAKALLTRIDAKASDSPQRRFHFAAVLLASGDTAAGASLLQTVKGIEFPGSGEVATLAPS